MSWEAPWIADLVVQPLGQTCRHAAVAAGIGAAVPAALAVAAPESASGCFENIDPSF